jgi:hypothetical protein
MMRAIPTQPLARIEEHREPVVHHAVGLAMVAHVLTRPSPPAGQDHSGA